MGALLRRGFTLIELLVVIAIMAILVSVLMPSLARARETGKGVVCLSNLHSIAQSVVLYAHDHREQFPVSSHTTGSIVAASSWLNSLVDYGVRGEQRLCPLDPFRTTRLASYAMNEHFEPLTPGVDFSPITKKPLAGGRLRAYRRISQVPRPAAVIYAYEPEGEGTTDHLNTHQFADAKAVRAAVAVTRHLGCAQFAFVDGHARAWAWSDLQATFSPSTSPFDPDTAR